MHQLRFLRHIGLADGLFDAVLVVATPRERFAPRVVSMNTAFETLFRLHNLRCRGRPLSTLRGTDPRQQRTRALRAAWQAGAAREGRGTRRLRSGERMPVAYRILPLGPSDGLDQYAIVERDLRPLERGRRRSAELRQVLEAQAEVLAEGLELPAVRQRVTEIGCALAGGDGAVLLEAQDRRLVGVAACGSSRADRSEAVDTDAAEACCRGGVAVVEAAAGPARSLIRMPLWHNGRCRGVLNVHSQRPRAFGDEQIRLLTLASTMFAISLEQAHEVAAESGRRRLLVDALPVLISYVDRDQRYREVNAAYGDWFGDSGPTPGRSLREGLGEEAYERIRPYVEGALRGERVTYETVIPYRSRPRAVEADYIPHRGRDGRVEGFFAVVRDIEDRKRAAVDYLTGVTSRFRFEELLGELYREARRYDRPLSLVLLDIDHFKSVNDGHGHAVGDRVLKAVAALVQGSLRDPDLVGRWGGEEFVVVLPQSDARSAEVLAERLRRRLEALRTDPVGRVTASFGVAELRPDDALDDLFQRADVALYQAKASGRNRVVRAADPRRGAL